MIDTKAIRAAAEFTKNNTSSSFSVIETDALIVLLDRLEAAEKDAARYRHFRHGNRLTVKCKSATVMFGPNTEHDYPEQLDVAIDAAMKEQK